MKTPNKNSYVTGVIAVSDRQPNGNIEIKYVTRFHIDKDGLLTTVYGSQANAHVFNLKQDKDIIKAIRAQINDFEVDTNEPSFMGSEVKIRDFRTELNERQQRYWKRLSEMKWDPIRAS